MAIKGSNFWTFRDIASGRLPNGKLDPDVINMIGQNNPFIQDILWKECVKGREDITTIKTGMPKATLRRFYQGIEGSKSTKKQVTNSCATVSSALKFDWRIYEAQPDKAAYLKDEQADHSEVVTDGVARLLWYGETKDTPDAVNGFASVYGEYASDALTDDKKSAFYCLNGAHAAGTPTGENRSIYMVGWGRKSAYAIYPQGSNAGIQIGELKSQYLPNTEPDGRQTDLLWGIQEFNHDVGLTVKDFRYCGRVCNIDIGRAFEASGVPDYTMLIRRLACRVKEEGVNRHLYMCRMMFEVLSVQFAQKTQENAVKYGDLQQGIGASLLGIPVSFNDVLNVDEAAVPQIA